MKKQIFKPQYALGGEGLSVSLLENTTDHGTSVAAFHWKNVPYPYWHKHEHWEILLVLDGKVQHKINDTVHTATKGYACLIRPDDAHCFTFVAPKSEILSLGFSNEIASQFFSLYPLDATALTSNAPLSFLLQASTLDAIISKALVAQFYPKDNYVKYTIMIVNRILLAYHEQKLNSTEAYPDWLNSFLLLLKNPHHLRLSVAELATFTPYSYSHLSTLFKQYTGKTIVAYLNELKLIRAKELLRNTDYTVGEIAVDLNYESISSLNHNFKRFTGLTPSEFRKSSSDF